MSWIPKDKGFLPYFLLVDSALSWFTTIQAYLNPASLNGTAGMYTGPNSSQVTTLSVHTFGSWLILSGFIRFYAAYNLSNPGVYALAHCTFVAISWHYLTEWLVFRTVDFTSTLVCSLVMDCGALVWMWVQRKGYVRES